MKKLLAIISLIMLSSCGASWQLSTLNHDPIYEDENYIVVSDDVKIDTLSEFQFRNKLRTDIGFRLDFARYALSQPRSFDWNNRLLGRQYDSRWNNYYWGWNRDQMWNDWAWGYTGWNSWGSPHRWSPFGYDRWGYGIYYGWNNHGWGYNNWMGNVHYGNGYYNNWGWNNYYGNGWRRGNTSYIYGRRGSNISVQQRNGRAQAAMIESSRRRTNVNTKPNNTRIVKEDNKEILILKDRNGNQVRYEIKPNNNTRPNNNTKPRGYGRPEINNNNKPNRTNTRPNRNSTRPNSTPVIRNNNTRPTYNNSTRPTNNSRSTTTTRNSRSNTRKGN